MKTCTCRVGGDWPSPTPSFHHSCGTESDEPVPEGEFEIEQLLCSDTDGAVLVKWVGHEVPTWEPPAAMPAATREAYRRQGRVELQEYLALLNVAC